MPSSSTPQQQHNDSQYELDNSDMDGADEDIPQSATNVKSQLAAALAARGSSMDNLHTNAISARKRKQSSPQPLRELGGVDGSSSGAIDGDHQSGPGPSKVLKAGGSPLEAGSGKFCFTFD